MDELNKFRADDVEHDIFAKFDKVVTIPVMTDGKDSGVTIYVGLTNIGRFAIGAVSDKRIAEIASRITLATKEPLPPASEPGS